MYGGAEKANAATSHQRALHDNRVFLQRPELFPYILLSSPFVLFQACLLFKILTIGLVRLTTMIPPQLKEMRHSLKKYQHKELAQLSTDVHRAREHFLLVSTCSGWAQSAAQAEVQCKD